MRHTFATSMLEAGVDLLTFSKLLGHASFVTTMIYLHVRRQHFDRSPSPIEGPPHGQSRPAHVLRYLTRYLTGGPIHDSRIISDEDGMIKFWARSRNKAAATDRIRLSSVVGPLFVAGRCTSSAQRSSCSCSKGR